MLLATGSTPRVLPGRRARRRADPVVARCLHADRGARASGRRSGPGSPGPSSPAATASSGVPVTLVSSRDRVLPGEDIDAADVIEEVFTLHGGTLVKQARAASARPAHGRRGRRRTGGRTHGGRIARADLRRFDAQHGRLGLDAVGVAVDAAGYITDRSGIAHERVEHLRRRRLHRGAGAGLGGGDAGPDRDVARARRGGRAAAAAQRGGERVHQPRDRDRRGADQRRSSPARCRPARSCCRWRRTPGRRCRDTSTASSSCTAARPPGWCSGRSVVAPAASELIFPFSLAVQRGLTVSEVAATFAVYPSLSGSLAEAARQLVQYDEGIELREVVAMPDLSPEAKERARRTIAVSQVIAAHADEIAAGDRDAAGRARAGRAGRRRVPSSPACTGSARSELIERIADLEGPGGSAMVFSRDIEPGARPRPHQRAGLDRRAAHRHHRPDHRPPRTAVGLAPASLGPDSGFRAACAATLTPERAFAGGFDPLARQRQPTDVEHGITERAGA